MHRFGIFAKGAGQQSRLTPQRWAHSGRHDLDAALPDALSVDRAGGSERALGESTQPPHDPQNTFAEGAKPFGGTSSCPHTGKR